MDGTPMTTPRPEPPATERTLTDVLEDAGIRASWVVRPRDWAVNVVEHVATDDLIVINRALARTAPSEPLRAALEALPRTVIEVDGRTYVLVSLGAAMDAVRAQQDGGDQ
jgi:hypothetical protein